MSNKAQTAKQTFGIGYATVIMIFVIICLSILALLSYNASGISRTLDENNRKYMAEYYSAQQRVEEKTALLDGAAFSALQTPFFDMSFETAALEADGVSCMREMGGYSVSFSEKINEKLSISVRLMFYSDPSLHGGQRYTVEEYKTVGTSETEGGHLGVWDGKTPIGG